MRSTFAAKTGRYRFLWRLSFVWNTTSWFILICILFSLSLNQPDEARLYATILLTNFVQWYWRTNTLVWTIGMPAFRGRQARHDLRQRKSGNNTQTEPETYESEYKIMIIWLPEKMNNQCANKLLKIPWTTRKTVFLWYPIPGWNHHNNFIAHTAYQHPYVKNRWRNVDFIEWPKSGNYAAWCHECGTHFGMAAIFSPFSAKRKTMKNKQNFERLFSDHAFSMAGWKPQRSFIA